MATITDPPHNRGAAATLARARRGDRRAFSRLMEPYRRELVAYCFRLTGALAEAEDLAQEAFLRAFRALGAFEGRATPRAWLYRIAHNLCLNHVQRHPAWDSLEALNELHGRDMPSEGDAESEEREDVRLGFVALVQSLPPRQRAALVLRDVLGWSAEETARILETTVPSVKNALARARRTLAQHPHGMGPADVPDLAASDPAARSVIAEWVDAFEKGNTARMVALLTADPLPEVREKKSSQTGYNKGVEKVDNHGQETPLKRRDERSRQREERTDAQRQRA